MPYGPRLVFGDAGGSISSVMASLPMGMQLGEERFHNGVFYRFMYNTGGASITAGYLATPSGAASGSVNNGAYSCTVTSTSDGADALGAVIAYHATVPTANYFWGAFRGYPVALAAGTSSIASGGLLMVGPDGKVTTMVTAVTASAIDPNAQNYCIGKVVGQAYSGIASTTTGMATVMTGTRSGDCYISFPDYVF